MRRSIATSAGTGVAAGVAGLLFLPVEYRALQGPLHAFLAWAVKRTSYQNEKEETNSRECERCGGTIADG